MEIFTPNALPLKQVIDSSYIIYMYLLKSCKYSDIQQKKMRVQNNVMQWNTSCCGMCKST